MLMYCQAPTHHRRHTPSSPRLVADRSVTSQGGGVGRADGAGVVTSRMRDGIGGDISEGQSSAEKGQVAPGERILEVN